MFQLPRENVWILIRRLSGNCIFRVSRISLYLIRVTFFDASRSTLIIHLSNNATDDGRSRELAERQPVTVAIFAQPAARIDSPLSSLRRCVRVIPAGPSAFVAVASEDIPEFRAKKREDVISRPGRNFRSGRCAVSAGETEVTNFYCGVRVAPGRARAVRPLLPRHPSLVLRSVKPPPPRTSPQTTSESRTVARLARRRPTRTPLARCYSQWRSSKKRRTSGERQASATERGTRCFVHRPMRNSRRIARFMEPVINIPKKLRAPIYVTSWSH